MTGSGSKYFCTGQDGPPGDWPGITDPAELIAGLTIPVIAAINGDALGLGLEIALSCDIRIASEDARLGLPEIADGSIPSHGGTQRLPRLVGRGRALELILSGDLVSAQRALAMGLVDEVVAPDRVMQRAEELAGQIAHKAPVAARYAREAINTGLDLPLDQGLRLEGDLYLLLQTTADREEGIRAHREKRTPEFRGK